MDSAIEKFRADLKRARDFNAIYKALTVNTTPALELSDILRSELVMSVSALDRYIHEIIRIGMLEAYHDGRNKTPQFGKFMVSMQSVLEGFFPQQTNDDWLEKEIIAQHSYKTFQRAENIAEAIRFISSVKLWEEVSKRLNMPAVDVKKRLDLIITRRNQIAHEADSNPSFPDTRWPINENMVNDAVNFIETIAESIYAIIKNDEKITAP